MSYMLSEVGSETFPINSWKHFHRVSCSGRFNLIRIELEVWARGVEDSSEKFGIYSTTVRPGKKRAMTKMSIHRDGVGQRLGLGFDQNSEVWMSNSCHCPAVLDLMWAVTWSQCSNLRGKMIEALLWQVNNKNLWHSPEATTCHCLLYQTCLLCLWARHATPPLYSGVTAQRQEVNSICLNIAWRNKSFGYKHVKEIPLCN